MKQKTCMILFLAALASMGVGCNKTGTQGEPDPALEPLVFSGTNVVTKAVFTDGLVSGALEWSDYDNLGVYSCDASTNALVHQGFAALSSKAGDDAVFQSGVARSTWSGNGAYEHLLLCAYYPQMKSPQAYLDGTGYINLNVPAIQNGEFGKYHICYSQIDMDRISLEGGTPVAFTFAPKTALLRVRPVVAAGSEADKVYIKQLVVSIGNGKQLAGDCKMPIPGGNLALNVGNSSSAISVVLPSPITITKTAEQNPYIDVVILPENAQNAVLSFYVIASDGTKFTMTGKLAPVQFQAGTRYHIDRPILVSLDGTPDGQYIDGGYAWSYTDTEEDGAYIDGGIAW